MNNPVQFFILSSSGDGQWIRKLLKDWDARLESGLFLSGNSQQPGLMDFELMGQMESMSCGLTDWTMPVLRQNPNLMRWLKQGWELLYSEGLKLNNSNTPLRRNQTD